MCILDYCSYNKVLLASQAIQLPPQYKWSRLKLYMEKKIQKIPKPLHWPNFGDMTFVSLGFKAKKYVIYYARNTYTVTHLEKTPCCEEGNKFIYNLCPAHNQWKYEEYISSSCICNHKDGK